MAHESQEASTMRKFLEETVKLRSDVAESVFKELHFEQQCESMKDMIGMEFEQWKEIFDAVELEHAPKLRLLEAVNKLLEEDKRKQLDTK